MERKIHIGSLGIRLKNVSPERARGVGNNLGYEILRHIADGTKQNSGARRIENLDGGTLKSESGAADLQNRIARRIAALIGERNR